MDERTVLQMKGVKKYFPGVKALDGVDFELQKGEIHALLGENGAGKSTLIKILTGIYSMTEGSIHIKGEEVHMKSVKDARENRIAAIHQEICLVPYISVARNVYLGRELKNKLGLMDDKTMEAETQKLLDRLGMDIDASKEVRQYSIAQQQLIEIAKALALDAEILLMDEPTSSLTEKEVTKLFETIRRLKENGTSIIYISHRMDELFELSDRVTVLRDGQYIGTYVTKDTTREELVAAMVGRQLTEFYVKDSVPQEEVYLEVKNLSRAGVFQDVSFSLKKGEILGVSGMVGAGRSEVARAIVGIDAKDSGEVLLEGKLLDIKKPIDAINAGIVLIPENRKEEGLVLENSVRFNTTLAVLKEFIRGVFWNRKKEEEIVGEHVKTLNIRTPHYEQLILNLSGGNQQKVVIAKWLATQPKILIMDEPTRGVDVGAKAEIYTIMNSLAKQGISIIMISSDLPEIINMSDRVLVMREGKLAGVLSKDEIGQEQIMRYAV
ncbi:MAG: sugar ABC transporter ATP-binding protein [Oscillospiraceae bacterium]|nr:sugar ABC transporter ATP-binding protein [Oscillospiraceae bacterium]